MEYPREKLEIQVLDDSTDETVDVARSVVERYAALGHEIVYHPSHQPRKASRRARWMRG